MLNHNFFTVHRDLASKLSGGYPGQSCCKFAVESDKLFRRPREVTHFDSVHFDGASPGQRIVVPSARRRRYVLIQGLLPSSQLVRSWKWWHLDHFSFFQLHIRFGASSRVYKACEVGAGIAATVTVWRSRRPPGRSTRSSSTARPPAISISIV
jgi:hypothetical protein